MFGVHDYVVFLSAGILLNLTPGQDTFYIVGCSLAGGQRVGVASALGIAAGSVVHTVRAAFRKGMLTNLLNPKVALFFLAFMPQFIDPGASSKVAAFVFLGASFITTGTIWCLVLALAAALLRAVVLRRAGAAGVLTRMSGGLFVLLGLRMATTTR